MLLITPGCDSFKRALIANGLSSVCANTGGENIIVDMSVAGTEAFWSLYKSGIKYIEDILPVLPAANHKMLKNFLSPNGLQLVLAFKTGGIEDVAPDVLSFMITSLENAYKYVFVILPDNLKNNSFELLKKAECALLPFTSDGISSKNAIFLLERILSEAASSVNILPFKLNLGYDFHSEKILGRYDIFSKGMEAPFDAETQEQIMSPKYSYRDESSAFTAALRNIIKYVDSGEKHSAQKSESENFYSNESVYKDLRNKVHGELVDKMKAYADETDADKLKKTARTKIEEILKKLDIDLPQSVTERLFKELCDDVAGLGVLEDFLKDPAVTEIMVNGPDSIYIEKAGKLFESGVTFPDEKRLKTVIDRIVSEIGRHIDEASPIVDARLKDGSRVNAVIRPISLNGPALTIRKFLKNKLSPDALISSGSITAEMVEFLKTAVILKRNIIISGGTGTGKTTLLNAVSSFIPEKERLVTIEDSAELQLQQKHVVRLESRPKSTEGSGEVSIRRLVVNALRMRPDRIIVGECRSGEALDMLQAMNTGHEGSMSTVHANSAYDAVSRLVTMVLMSGAELPEKSIVSQIASAINVIVQLTRYSDGTRKISSISAVNKTDDEKQYEIKPVFQFNLAGFENGMQKGSFAATGYIPDFIKNAVKSGVNIDMGIFKC
ncbi:MAG: CpaF family protein [Endomicrobia bacterium]|nr:CpaF family protein [Endomicrobiia bacterium]